MPPETQKIPGLVSIVLPTRDRVRVLRRTLDSILAQTYANWELIIVDDGSTDGTEKLVRSYADDRVRYFFNDGPHGVSAARNRGVERAHGEFLAFQDAGDDWVPEKLSLQVAALRAAPVEVGLVFSAMRRVHQDGTTSSFPASDVSAGDADLYHRALALGVILAPPTWLLRSGVIEGAGGFDERLHAREDLDLVIRIAQKFRMQRVDGDLARYHDDASSVSRNYAAIARAHRRIAAKHRAALREDRAALMAHLRIIAEARYMDNDSASARRLLFKILASGRGSLGDVARLAFSFGGRPLYDRLRSVWGFWRRLKSPRGPIIRIAFLSPESDLFGSERSMLEAVVRLDRNVVDPRIVTLHAGPLEEAALSRGVVVVRLPWLDGLRSAPWRLPFAAVRLGVWLKRERIDVLEINRVNYPLLGALWPAARLSGTRLVYRERMHADGALHGVKRFLVSRADRIIAVSRGSVAPWGGVLDDRIDIVPSGRDLRQLQTLPRDRSFVRSFGVPDGAPIVGMIGALDPRKRPEMFLRSARTVLDSRPDAWFLLVGAVYRGQAGNLADYEASLRALAEELSLKERAIFTGYREDAFRILQNLDVLVLPSQREALGGVLVEALIAGVPAVASNVDGVAEVVADGVTGILAPVEDEGAFASGVLRLLQDGTVRERMSRASLERAHEYDQDRLCRRLETIYGELIKRG
jgi:glycosyltransferase involved in cell wall biosynthesis